jgi:indole-3-glycerol phosphate synthase
MLRPNDIRLYIMSSHILATILQRKAEEVEMRQRQFPLASQEARARTTMPVRGFYHALKRRADKGEPAVIAEIKKASPSKGVFVKILCLLKLRVVTKKQGQRVCQY